MLLRFKRRYCIMRLKTGAIKQETFREKQQGYLEIKKHKYVSKTTWIDFKKKKMLSKRRSLTHKKSIYHMIPFT